MVKRKIIVVMPAYNAEKTLEKTFRAIPKGSYDDVVVVDDVSKDRTVQKAKELGLHIVQHKQNRGYGGNQKTCFREALKRGATIVVLLHPDNQYDPTLVPKLTAPILKKKADVVYGSRMLVGGMAKKGGMPLWRRIGNRLLTDYMNIMIGTRLTDSATGYIAYSRRVLEAIPFMENDDGFCFDEEAIIQCAKREFRMAEIPIPTRYDDESSSIRLRRAIKYGATLFWEITLYKLQQLHLVKLKKFS